MAFNIQRRTSDIANVVVADASRNVTLPADLTVTALVNAGLIKANAQGKLVAAVAGTDYQAPLTNPVTGTGSSGRVAFWTGSNTQSSDSNLFWDNTNKRLGIGTASPTVVAEIVSSDATLNLRHTSSTAYAGVNMYDDGNSLTGSFQIGGSTSTPTSLRGNMFIGARKASGNLIFVRGVAATQSGVLFSNGNWLFQDGGTFTDSGGILQVTQSGSTAGISVSGGTNPQMRATDGTRISKLQVTSAIGLVGTESNHDFGIYTNNSEKMRITSGGSLGLGVTPQAWGRVGFEIGVEGAAITRATRNLVLLSNAYWGATDLIYAAGAGAGRYDVAVDGHRWYTAPSGTAGNPITFTQTMTLDASGNLNIGQISSALQSGGTGLTIYGASNSEIKFLNSTTGATASDGTALVANGSNFTINNREAGSLIFGTSNTTQMTLTANGRLLLGTTTEGSELLQVNGTSRFTGNITIDDTGTAVLSAQGNVSTNFFINSRSTLTFQTGGAYGSSTTRMTIGSTGNVGINQDSPVALLHIKGANLTGTSQIRENLVLQAQANGTNNSLGSIVGITFTMAQAGYTAASFNRSSGVYGVSTDNTEFARSMGVVFYTSAVDGFATEKMRLDSGGNLGLGVTPSAWGSGNTVIDIRNRGSIAYLETPGNFLAIANNSYYDGTAYKRKQAAGAAQLNLGNNGAFAFLQGADGAANDPITFTETMSLNASGSLSVLSTITASGRTRIGGGYIADISGTGNNTGISFGPNAVFPTNGAGGYTIKDLGSTASPWGTPYFGPGGSDGFMFINGWNNGQIRFIANPGFNVNYNGLLIESNYTNANSLPAWSLDLGGANNTLIGGDKFAIGRKPNGGSYTNFFNISSSGVATINSNLILSNTSIEQNDSNGLTINSSNASGFIKFRVAGAERASISNTGAATFSSSVTATSFFESSDARLKSDIKEYSDDVLAGLTAKIYRKNGKVEIGYLAQDVEGIYAPAVSEDSNGYKNLSYREVHTAKIAALEKEIRELKKMLYGRHMER